MARTVLVSAGHSTVPPIDSGAVGNGYKESELALELRDMVARLLRGLGVTVVTDGDEGASDPLRKAIRLARASDVAVEIHWNASNGAGHGIEVLCKERHKPLAKLLAGAVNQATGLTLRGDSGWKSDSSGHHKKLGFCEAGGLILEVCFIDNANDMAVYQANKRRVAEKLANVLAREAGKSATINSNEGPVRPPTQPQTTTPPTYQFTLIRRGMRGPTVRRVQERLRAGGSTITADSIFGDDTERAVRAFQRRAGLDDDGVVGRYTWRAMFPG